MWRDTFGNGKWSFRRQALFLREIASENNRGTSVSLFLIKHVLFLKGGTIIFCTSKVPYFIN